MVDDRRDHVLKKLMKTKNGVKKTESDHNPIISKLKIQWNKHSKKQRTEMFNLKNKECQAKFKAATLIKKKI